MLRLGVRNLYCDCGTSGRDSGGVSVGTMLDIFSFTARPTWIGVLSTTSMRRSSLFVRPTLEPVSANNSPWILALQETMLWWSDCRPRTLISDIKAFT